MTADGAASLANALASSQCLREVLLDGNNLQPEGGRLLSKAVEQSQMQELHLNDTNIGDEGPSLSCLFASFFLLSNL